MKAVMNGVPSPERARRLVDRRMYRRVDRLVGQGAARQVREAASLYKKLASVIGPMFYQESERFIDVMVHTIALNGSFFNTHRMIQQYVLKAYL